MRQLENGRWRTLIISETIILTCLVAVIVSLLILAGVRDGVGVGWFALFILGSGLMGEAVRRFRHLRTDLRRDWSKE